MDLRSLLTGLVAAGLVAACEDPSCGPELRYDRASELCICPNGGRYTPGDGGYLCVLPDGSVTPFGDAGPIETPDAGAPDDACETRTLHRDTDGDGFGDAAQTMESCGDVAGWVEDATDCDDACESCFPGASETCDGLDNDCDRVEDEGLVTSSHYVDCDGDGYAPAGASFVVACAEPEDAPEACAGGGWTTRAPTVGATDCADRDANAFPGQTEWFETAIAGVPAAVDFDYDCDGVETQEITGTAGSVEACFGSVSSCATGFPGLWRGDVAPACGGTGEVSRCVLEECRSEWSARVQGCR